MCDRLQVKALENTNSNYPIFKAYTLRIFIFLKVLSLIQINEKSAHKLPAILILNE